MIVIDEFAEFKKTYPDFGKEIDSLTMTGSSLGISVVLMAQNLTGVLSTHSEANVRFRWCLHVANSGFSRDLLGKTGAERLRYPGRAIIKVGDDEVYEEVQGFWSSAPYDPSAMIQEEQPMPIATVAINGNRRDCEVFARKKTAENGWKENRAIVNYIARYCEESGIPNAEKIWTNPLPERITLMPGQSQVKVFGGEKSEQYHDGLVKFIEEARRLAKFQNEPGIVKIFDSFEENDTAYIVMEYLDGETLTSYMDREGTISEDQAVEMLLPVLESLKTVHAAGILHRDIAPDNIFLTKDGEVKLIDFGASRYATTSHSRSLTVIIKPGFSPEEQYRSRGDQGPHTDVYALAATMYKMVTGQTPPDAMERRAKYENQNKDILIPPHKVKKGISAIRENAILNAMNVRIEDRTPDVDTFISELTSKTPAKRKYGKIKKIDVYAWPTWAKILLPSVLGIALLIGVLLMTGVISFSSRYSRNIVVPENIVSVPGVEGMERSDALSAIEGSGLLARTGGTVQSEYVHAGLVVLQEPSGGTYIERNGTVEGSEADRR